MSESEYYITQSFWPKEIYGNDEEWQDIPDNEDYNYPMKFDTIDEAREFIAWRNKKYGNIRHRILKVTIHKTWVD